VPELKEVAEVTAAGPPVARTALVATSAAAGALAVPLHSVATPLSAVLFALFAFLGLLVWRWSRLPYLVRLDPQAGARRFLKPAAWMGAGLVVGLLLLAVIRLAIEPSLPAIGERMAAAGQLPIWRRLAVIYVAAVGEELLFRLILLSAIAALASKLTRGGHRPPAPPAAWTAIALSALLFGAVHLPSWGGASLGAGLALSVVLLNAAGGVFLGYVFVTRGIVAAIWAHAGADCAIQLIGPLTG